MKRFIYKIDRFIGIAVLLAVVLGAVCVYMGPIGKPKHISIARESLHDGMEYVNTVVLAEMKSVCDSQIEFETSEILRGDMREKTFSVYDDSKLLKTGKTYLLFLQKEDRVTEDGETYGIRDRNSIFELKKDGTLEGITQLGDKYLEPVGNTVEDIEVFLKNYTFSPVPPVYDTMNSLEELWEKADNVSVVRHYIDKHSSQTAITVLNELTLKGESGEASPRVVGRRDLDLKDKEIYIMFFKNRGTDTEDWQLLTRYDSIYPIESEEAQKILKMAGYEGSPEDFYKG